MNRCLVTLVCLLLAATSQVQAEDRVRIAVAGLFHSREMVVETLPGQPLIVKAADREFIIGASSPEQLTLTQSRGAVSFRYKENSGSTPSINISGRSGDGEFILAVPRRFRRNYRGSLTVEAGRNDLVPVVSMELETAVASVVAAEAGSSTPLEALKALAVASRSYLVAGGHRHPTADFCDTTHCQFLRNPPAPGSPAHRAAGETKGLILKFAEKPLPAMYSASCGGRTHSLQELGLPAYGYPYFAVECSYCRRNPERWVARLAESEATMVRKGERERIALARQLGWNVVPSNTFETKPSTGGAVLSGVGHGHGLGLCQRGAAAMAREGKDFRGILAHYFPNTSIDSVTP